MQDLEITADKLGDVLEALEEDSRMAADPRMKTYHGYTLEEAEVLANYMCNRLVSEQVVRLAWPRKVVLNESVR